MKLQLFFWVLIFISGMGPDLEAGEIYQWIDKDGGQHFTDGPPPPGAQIVEGLSETQPDEPSAGTRPANRKDTGAVKTDENSSTDGGDTDAVESGDRRFRKWKSSPPDPEEEGAVEGGDKGPTDGEDPGSVESGDRRFRKWKSDPTDREETGAVEGGDKGPTGFKID